jgi:hypothetical protein
MIILDTHVWVWWVHGDEKITSTQTKIIKANETDIIGVANDDKREIDEFYSAAAFNDQC